MEWVLGALAGLAVGGVIWWAATKVERERAGRPPRSRIRVDGIFSGPVGTGLYKPMDDRRQAEKSAHLEEPAGKETSAETDRPWRSGS